MLTGWSYFQGFPEFGNGLEFEENGYFRKRDWFAQAGTLITTGQAGERPNSGKILETALRWNLEVALSTEVRGVPTGLAAYDQWMAHLLREEEFAGKDEATLKQMHEVHFSAVAWVATVRWYGSVWLKNTYQSQHHDLAESLLKAAGCWAGEHELMWKLWELCGGIENPDWQLFVKPEVRRELVALIQQSKERYAEAAGHLAVAVSKVK